MTAARGSRYIRLVQAAAAVAQQFPVLSGALPLIGHLPEMHFRFPSMCDRGLSQHGPLFWIRAGAEAHLVLTGPRALAVLKHPAVSTSFYTDSFSLLLGNTLLSFDGEEHRKIRQVLNPPFTPQRVRRSDILHIVRDTTERRVEAWRRAERIEIVRETRELALEIIFRVVGVPLERLGAWRKHYERYLLSSLPSEGGPPIRWWVKRSRSWLDREIAAIIDDKRRTRDTESFIGGMANVRDESGELLDRDLIVANVRILLLAGHETTASSMAWTAIHLSHSRELQERAMAEVATLGDLCEVTGNQERFTFAEALFREALRLYPPVHSIVRRVTAPIELDAATSGAHADGRTSTIAPGTLLNFPLVHMLRDPQRFPRPTVFDPGRWRERPRAGSVETAMFGGGPHFCLGYHIAIAEGTLFGLVLARALHEHGLALEPLKQAAVPTPVFLPLVHAPAGTRLRLVPSTRSRAGA
jgi:cytochrome P450